MRHLQGQPKNNDLSYKWNLINKTNSKAEPETWK